MLADINGDYMFKGKLGFIKINQTSNIDRRTDVTSITKRGELKALVGQPGPHKSY